MKISFAGLSTIIVAIFAVGCITFGPPLPQIHAKTYLQENGFDKDTIERLLNYKQLTNEEYKTLCINENENVRFMVGVNPYTPITILCDLADDKSDLVLQGVLRNKRLPQAKLNEFLDKQNLLPYIVGNPNLPEKTILQIYRDNKNISLDFFAINPKCPQEIRKAIQDSNNSLAKRWLEINEEKATKFICE